MDKKTKKRISIISNVVITIFLVFAVIVTIFATISSASSDGVPSIGNKVLLSIQSDSMEGENGFSKGSLIIAKKLTEEEKKNLKVGDVITFWKDLDGNGERELNTHRVVSVLGKNGVFYEFQTKGDNNAQQDGYTILDTDIVAIWQSNDFNGEKLEGTEIKVVGSILTFMTSQLGFLLIIILPLAIFFIFEIVNLIKVIGQIRGKKTISASDEEEIKRKAIEEYLKSQNAESSQEKPTTETTEETKE